MTYPHRFIAAVSVSGTAAAVASFALLETSSADVLVYVVFVAVAVLAAVIPLRFVRGEATQGFTLEGGVFVALLLTLPTGVVPLTLLSASATAHGIRSRDVFKSSFNAGKTGLETAAGSLVFALVAPAAVSPTDPRSLVAVACAVVAFEGVSTLAMAELFRRLSGVSRRTTIGEVGRLNLVTVSVNSAFGLLLAAVATVSAFLLALSAILMVALYVGFRGYAATIVDRRRSNLLNELTHALLDMTSGDHEIAGILEDLVAILGGTRGDLLADLPQGLLHWSYADGRASVRSLSEFPRGGVLATAAASDRGTLVDVTDEDGVARPALVAPLVTQHERRGGVVVRGRNGLEPWDQADASLLGAAANELAVALDNVALFRQVEEERARLEAESTKLNDILTAATDGIVSVLSDGTIEAWNPGMARISGVPTDVAVGQPWHAVLRLKDATGAELAPTGDHVVSRALAGSDPGDQLSLQILRADGVWRWVACTSSPVRNHDGTARGVVVVARDVTAERELEELKSDFIATVSHELRTPLTPLKGFLATLQQNRATLNEDQLGSVHRAMGAQLTRLETLISDLLAVAEIDHGQFELRPEPLEISELVTDAVHVEAGEELSRCTLLVEPDVSAVVDSVALVRIVRSLVSNAIKHTTGNVEITVRTMDEQVELSVRDDGPGIAPWDQQRVFNRFERLGNHLRRTQGPGLGLTIARSLARRMGGDITLTSDVGQGATFTLRVPRARPRPVPLRLATEA